MGSPTAYAYSLLKKGHSYQSAANASGLNVADLRRIYGPVTSQRAPVSVPVRPLPAPPATVAQPVVKRPRRALDVALYITEANGLTFADLCGDSRLRRIARPRQIAMYAIRELCPHMSLPAIARMLGGRDHTTVLHGVRKITALIETNPEIADAVADVLAHFRKPQDETEARPDTLTAATAFQTLCAQYGQAMRQAA